MKNILLLLGSVLLFGTLNAQKTGSISGTISDKDTSEIIPFATISLQQNGVALSIGTTSNFNGNFNIENLKVGAYNVVISFLGYESITIKDVSISTQNLNVDLGAVKLTHASEALEEVEVKATTRTVTNKIDRKTYKVSDFETARGGTATDVLNKLPSVSVNPDGQISVRGTQDFVVYLNGKPTAMDATMLLGQISSDAMVSVDVITVPTSKFDAQGKGGIINITTKSVGVEGFSMSVNGTIGGAPWGHTTDKYSGYEMTDNRYNSGVNLMYGTGKVLLYGGFNISDKNVNGERTGDARILDESTGAYKHMVASGERPEWYESQSVNVGLDYKISEASLLSTSYMYGNRTEGRSAFYIYNNFFGDADKNPIPGVPVNEEWIYNPNTDNRYGKFHNFNIDFSHQIDELTKISTSFSYENSNLSRELDNLNYEYDPLTDEIGEVTLHYNQTDETPLDGYRFSFNYEKEYENGNSFAVGLQPQYFSIDGKFNYEQLDGPVLDLENGIDLTRGIYAGYLDYSGSAGRFNYIAGLRLEYTDQVMEVENPDYFTIFNRPSDDTFKIQQLDWFPTFHADYELNETSKLNFAGSRRISRPPIKNMAPFLYRRHLEVFVVGDPNLEPEYVNNIELGYDKKLGKQKINLTGFYRGVDNAIFRVNTIYQQELVLIRSYTNAGNSTSLGVELNANFVAGDWATFFLGGSVYHYNVRGEIFGYNEDNRSTNWSLKGNANFDLSEQFKFTTDFDVKSATVTAQGQNDLFYMANVAINYAPKNVQNLTFNLKGLDILGSNDSGLDTQAFNSAGQEIFYQETQYLRVGPIVEFGVSYAFNKKKKEIKKNENIFGTDEF
ncbi:outer membrane beta-barrel family protein [Urechidicola vernalis]|uniref:Outer membrane beta-barrel family protein n=1 Tax=Urechidicola vernalis TaxID=3075600 RepID=A0ABU2Y4P0_9FLAO|nr:outer membrane beta-barrel family protein [Urechidicola sp. P050]MDT0553158.1 outer membrane beta-barrel family protein [Urechidicola sp. P050]